MPHTNSLYTATLSSSGFVTDPADFLLVISGKLWPRLIMTQEAGITSKVLLP